MLLSPLLFTKVLIARYYRNQHNLLMPLGLTIFVLSFVLIASTAGPYLVRTPVNPGASAGRVGPTDSRR